MTVLVEFGAVVPVAVAAAAVLSAPRYSPTARLTRPVRLTLATGSTLALGGLLLLLVTMGYGILLAVPIIVAGYAVMFAGVVAAAVTSLRGDETAP